MENKQCSGLIRTTGPISLLLAALLLFASPVNAADYSWGTSSAVYTGSGNTPEAAYIDFCQKHPSLSAGGFCVPPRYVLTRYSDTQWGADTYFANGSYNDRYIIGRTGTTCPPNTTWNTTLGKCEGDPCLPTIGQKVSHTHRWGDFTGAGTVGAKIDPPASICNMASTPNCQYVNTFNILRIYRYKDSNPNGVWADFEYSGNGISCTGTETTRATPGAPGQTRDKASTCTNKVTDAEGRVSYSCLATDVNKEPGEMNCGEVNGVFKCIPAKPSPALTDKKIETDVTETTNPDGSKSTETTTTTTITNCTGANACTSTTTVNTHTSGTNSDGSPGGESSTCTGAGCSNGAGTPEETTDTPETPEEPCDPATDPNACGQSSVAGEVCDSPVVCTGDAIQCAILRQQKAARCAQDEWQDVDPTEIKQAVAAEFTGPDYEPLEAGEGGTFDLSDMIDTSSSISSSCPAMPSINFNLAGASQSLDFDFIMLELCKYAEWFGFLMVAFAMYRAAEIVAGGFS